MAEHLGEAALVVVIALGGRVVGAACSGGSKRDGVGSDGAVVPQDVCVPNALTCGVCGSGSVNPRTTIDFGCVETEQRSSERVMQHATGPLSVLDRARAADGTGVATHDNCLRQAISAYKGSKSVRACFDLTMIVAGGMHTSTLVCQPPQHACILDEVRVLPHPHQHR